MGKLMDAMTEGYPDIARTFLAMRVAAGAAGPLSDRERELCMIAGLVSLQNREAMETHIERAARMGISQEEIVHAVLVNIGISAVLSRVVTVIIWIDEWFAAE